MRRRALPPSPSRSPRRPGWPAGCWSSASLITAVFVICAIFAPWLAPYGFAQSSAHGVRVPEARSPQLDPPVRHGPAVLRRPLPGDLGCPHGAGGGDPLHLLLRGPRGPAGLVSGFYGGWLDRVLVLIMDALYAFPSFLLAIVCLVPAHRHLRRQRDRGVAVADRGLHPAVLPGGPQHDAQRQGGDVHRGRPRHRGARHQDHAPLPVRQRHPERAGARHAERRRRHPHPGRPRLPRARHPVDRGGRVGPRPEPALADAGVRGLVDRRSTRAWRSCCWSPG